MSLLTSLAVRLAGSGVSRRFDRAAAEVESTQLRLLRAILQQNAATEYGKKHRFAGVKSLADYRQSVPVIDYDDIGEQVQRMAAGEHSVLTSEDPVMFAMTSGTAGVPKLIPVTPTCLSRAHKDQMKTWVYRSLRDHPRMLDGKILSLVSAAEEGRTSAGIPFGSTSGTIYRNMPWHIRRNYVVPYEVFTVEDYLAKYYVILLLGLTARVTMAVSTNPSSLAKLCEIAEQSADKLLADLRDGTIDRDLQLPKAIRELLAPRLRSNPMRARDLEAARQRRGGRLLPVDFWPDLQLIGAWKGGTVSNYIERFPTWFAPDDPGDMPAVRDLGYLSSEARCSVPVCDEGAGGVLSVGSNVYEFVSADEVADHPDEPAKWTFLGAHEIEQPDDYHIFLTTTGGLYRYDINDIVRVVDRYLDAPVIEFVRKGGGMTSLTGEKLSVTQVKAAVEAAAVAHGISVEHFRALAMVQESRYEFEVQAASTLTAENAGKLIQEIDRQLAEQNIEYRSKRDSMRLNPPLLHVMQAGWHDAEKEQQGKRLFQSKSVLLVTVDKDAATASPEFRVSTVSCQDGHDG